MKKGLHYGIPNDVYHKDKAISSSLLKPALVAPSAFKAAFDELHERTETDAMRLGTTVHTLVLEPERFGIDVVVGQKWGRKKADLEAKAEWLAEHEGATVITPEQYEQAQRMRDSLLLLPDMGRVLPEAEFEVSGWYDDPDTGLRCRYRPDIRTPYLLADIKTCADASEEGFSRTIHNYGYHMSAAHYLEAEHALDISNHDQWVFFCVEKTPPYLAATYRLSADALNKGRALRRHALRAIKAGFETGHWPGLNNDEAREIDLPRWAY